MSGLTDAEREVVCICAELVSVNVSAEDEFIEATCEHHAARVEAIIAARVSDAVAAFRTEAVDAIEAANAAGRLIHSHRDGTTYAAHIVRDLNT